MILSSSAYEPDTRCWRTGSNAMEPFSRSRWTARTISSTWAVSSTPWAVNHEPDRRARCDVRCCTGLDAPSRCPRDHRVRRIVYTGGLFTTIGGQPRNRIAQLDAVTGQWRGSDPNADGAVRRIIKDGLGSISPVISIPSATRSAIAALDIGFTTVNGQPRAYLAIWDDVAAGSTEGHPRRERLGTGPSHGAPFRNRRCLHQPYPNTEGVERPLLAGPPRYIAEPCQRISPPSQAAMERNSKTRFGNGCGKPLQRQVHPLTKT